MTFCHFPFPSSPVTFRSRHDPGEASRAAVLFRAQTESLAWGAFGLMTVTLAAVLEGASVWLPFFAGLALVVGASALVARGRLDRTPARLEVGGGTARLWSVWEAASPRARPEALGVYEARLVRGELVVSLGDAVESLHRADWPDFEALVDAVRAAALESDAVYG